MSSSTKMVKDGRKGPKSSNKKGARLSLNSDGTPAVYMEDETFYLPVLEEGVVALGDLWDCRSNTAVGNLFEKELGKEHLEANAIESQDYRLYHSGNTRKVVDNLNVSAELKIGMTTSEGTKVLITGSALYDNQDQTNFDEQFIRVHYDVVTYQVRVRPAARDVISKLIQQHIQQGKITATHFVEAITLGGQAHGKLRYSENIQNHKMTIGGSFQLKITPKGEGGLNIDAKASLLMLDEENNKSYNTRVSVKAQPRLEKSPTKVKDMFDEIEKLDKLTNEQKHFLQLGDKVCGVPIGFRLVPIYRILDELENGDDQDPVFKKMTERIMNEFQSMLCTLADFTNPEYTKSLICEQKPALVLILRDVENPLTKDLSKWTIELIKIAQDFQMKAFILYGEYKQGNKTELDIDALIKEYNKPSEEGGFDILRVMQKIGEFVARGKHELNGIRSSDVVDLLDELDRPTVTFFTNVLDLEEWYNPERTIKILLQTNPEEGSPSGVFLKLFDMSKTLRRQGVEVGVAFPNISQDFSLTFKTHKKTTVYTKEEIPFVLEVLGIAVDEGETISTLFYSLNASLSGLYLPMVDHLDDIPSLVSVMDQYRGTIVCETYVQLLATLLETQDSWNFVFPVQALNTGIEMMRFYRQLRVLLPQKFPNLKHRWIVSRFNGTNLFDSPLMFVFKDDTLQGVCLDRLEMLILLEQLATPNPDLSLISYRRMKESSLYTPRVDFATDIIQNLILDHPTWISDPMEPWSVYSFNPDKALEEAMRFMRAACMRDEPNILSCVALQAISLSPELEGHLIPFGWKDKQFQRSQWNKNDWREFLTKLKGILGASAPFLMKIAAAITELNAIPSDARPAEIEKQIPGIIKFLIKPATRRFLTYNWRGMTINEDDVFKDLRQEIETYLDLPPDSMKLSITNAFQAFYDQTTRKEEYFYLVNLITLVDALDTTMNEANYPTFKHTLNSLAKKYCAQLDINDGSEELPDVDVLETQQVSISTEEYPNAWRKIKEALARRQLFKVLDVLAQVQYHPLLYLIHQELFNLTALPAPTAVKSIIEKLSFQELGYFDEEGRLEVIWNNPKFLYMLRQVIDNDGVLGSLFVFVSVYDKLTNKRALSNSQEEEEDEDTMIMVDPDAEEEISVQFPKCIPSDIVEKVKPMFALRKGPEFNWLKTWPDLQSLIDTFQIISIRGQMPLEFGDFLRVNVGSVKEIRDFLGKADCLYYWNADKSYFEHPWSILTLHKALSIIMNTVEAERKEQRLADFPPITASETTDRAAGRQITVNDKWKNFTKGGTLAGVTSLEFLSIDKLRPLEMIEYEDLGSSAEFILPYVMQQLKMLNATILSPSVVSKFVNYPLPGLRPGQIDFGEGISNRSVGLLISRSDIQAALLYTSDPFVVHHLLDGMIRGPVALPLILPDIQPSPINIGLPTTLSCKLLFPSLQTLVVPEMEALVPQPHLFQGQFRFVVTLRVGDTSPDTGKSSLINELLMKDPNTFSCWNEPGKNAGRSLGRNGLLEFTWLSPTTCKEYFWTTTLLPEYQSQRKEMILLGNLHGDATQFRSIFEILKPIVSCYVVFWKASNWTDLKAKKKLLTNVLPDLGKTLVLDVVLYPDSSIAQQVHEQNLILKSDEDNRGSMAGLNEAKLQRIFKEAIRPSVKLDREPTETPIEEDEGATPKLAKPLPSLSFSFSSLTKSKGATSMAAAPFELQIQESLPTPESLFLTNFVQTHTIDTIKKSFQKCEGSYLEEFFVAFNKLLALPLQSRLNGLLHFQYELDYLSRRARKETLARVRKLRNSINERYRKEISPNEKWVLDVQNEIKMYLEELELETLSVQDIFRAAYTPATWNDRGNNLPISYNQYFLYFKYGFPVELLHPTYGQGMFQLPLNKFFQQLPKNTRIFVISMAGIKDSGKSTLLNRLFGYGFREDSSTFGLQMRLLWLDEDYKDELNCDAFVLIDSEGMGGGENKVDAGADAWERRLLTFLLGISDLTLINSLGSTLDEMSPIVQVAITGLSKIDALAVQPDIFIVNQELKGEVNMLGLEFGRSLEEAQNFSTSREFATGVLVREDQRLKAVKSRLNHGEIVHEIRPLGTGIHQDSQHELYHEDVQTLYSKIIKKCNQSRQLRQKLGAWHGFAEDYWTKILQLPFPFEHPTIRSMEEGLDLEGRIAQVKEAIDQAFFLHEKVIDGKFTDELIDRIFGSDTEEEKPDPYKLSGEIDLFMRNQVDSELKKVINTCTMNASADGGSRRRLRTAAAAPMSPDACSACTRAYTLRETLFADMIGRKRGFLIEDDIKSHTYSIRESIFQRFQQAFYARQIQKGKFDQNVLSHLQEISKDEMRWEKVLQFVSTKQTLIPSRAQFDQEIQQVYKSLGYVTKRHLTQGEYTDIPQLDKIPAFDVDQYNAALESSMNSFKDEKLDWMQFNWLVAKLEDVPPKILQDYDTNLFKPGMAYELQRRVEEMLERFSEYCDEKLLPKFMWEAHLYAIQLFSKFVDDKQRDWDLANDPLTLLLARMEEDFFEDVAAY